MSLSFVSRWRDELPSTYTLLSPTPLENARVIWHNEALAKELNIPKSLFEDGAGVWGGEKLLPGMSPLAQVYSGHQFGVWAGQLGDGRGILLGEQLLKDGSTMDWHLKGAGLTPYSRFLDGRAVLRSTIRESLASEALHYLGIPTTRALSIVTSDTQVIREKAEAGAMLMRLSKSHMRFGHFEHFYSLQQPEVVQKLADFAIRHYWPHLNDEENKYTLWFKDVVARTASLIADWQAVGFAHGVMNTDNMSVLGLTIDYGPYGFMEDYDPGYVCNHSDPQGRYSFENQPAVGLWDLRRLAQSLSDIVPMNNLKEALEMYNTLHINKYNQKMRQKMGFFTVEKGDTDLTNELLAMMEIEGRDYTRTFRMLSKTEQQSSASPLCDEFDDKKGFSNWFERYRARLQREQVDDARRQQAMQSVNPAVVLRNWLAQRAIENAEKGDMTELHRLHEILRNPFVDRNDEYDGKPPDWGKHLVVGCSS